MVLIDWSYKWPLRKSHPEERIWFMRLHQALAYSLIACSIVLRVCTKRESGFVVQDKVNKKNDNTASYYVLE